MMSPPNTPWQVLRDLEFLCHWMELVAERMTAVGGSEKIPPELADRLLTHAQELCGAAQIARGWAEGLEEEL